MASTTYCRWRDNYQAYGLAGLLNESRARDNPLPSPARAAAIIEKGRLWYLEVSACQEVISGHLRREAH